MTEYNKIPSKPIEAEVEVEEVVERVKLTQIAKSKVKKRGVIERLVINFIGPDGIRDISKKLADEIVVPAVKNIIVDAFTSGIQMAILGKDEVHGYRNDRTSYNGPSNQYWKSSAKPHAPTNNYTKAQNRNPQGNYVRDYVLEERAHAVSVLQTLREQISKYGATSISDYNDLTGQDSTYTENQYGWRDLSGARIIPSRGGYVIKLPAFYEI